MGSGGAQPGVAVFEAVNETRREFYIGTTTDVSALETLPQSVTFRSATRWEAGETIAFRVVESGLGPDEALSFIANYAKTVERTGWKVLTE